MSDVVTRVPRVGLQLGLDRDGGAALRMEEPPFSEGGRGERFVERDPARMERLQESQRDLHRQTAVREARPLVLVVGRDVREVGGERGGGRA